MPELWEFQEGERGVEKREKVVGQDKGSTVDTVRRAFSCFLDLAGPYYTVRTARMVWRTRLDGARQKHHPGLGRASFAWLCWIGCCFQRGFPLPDHVTDSAAAAGIYRVVDAPLGAAL